jgi:hypothetical protein
MRGDISVSQTRRWSCECTVTYDTTGDVYRLTAYGTSQSYCWYGLLAVPIGPSRFYLTPGSKYPVSSGPGHITRLSSHPTLHNSWQSATSGSVRTIRHGVALHSHCCKNQKSILYCLWRARGNKLRGAVHPGRGRPSPYVPTDWSVRP